MYHRIDYVRDGHFDYELIFLPMQHHRMVEAHYQELKRILSAFSPESWTDDILYPRLTGLSCRKIGELLFPTIPVTLLTPESRAAFFFRTADVLNPLYVPKGQGEASIQFIPGLSGLEQLLDYSYSSPASTSTTKSKIRLPTITSGDSELDTIASILTSPFPERMEWLLATFSRSQISRILRQCADLSNSEQKMAELQQEIDKERVAKNPQLAHLTQVALVEAMGKGGVPITAPPPVPTTPLP